MELLQRDRGRHPRSEARQLPSIEVLLDGCEESTDVGVMRVRVPGRARILQPEERDSDIVVLPIAGSVEIEDTDGAITVEVGDAAVIRRADRASLRNPNRFAADLILAAGSSAFAASVRSSTAFERDPIA